MNSVKVFLPLMLKARLSLSKIFFLSKLNLEIPWDKTEMNPVQFNQDRGQAPVVLQLYPATPTVSSLRNPRLRLKYFPSRPTTMSTNQMKTLNPTQTISRTKTSCSLEMKTRRVQHSQNQDQLHPSEGRLNLHLQGHHQPHSQCSQRPDQVDQNQHQPKR